MPQSMLAYAQQLVAEAEGRANNEAAQHAESPQRTMQKSTYMPRIERGLLEQCALDRSLRESRRRLMGGELLVEGRSSTDLMLDCLTVKITRPRRSGC